VIRLRAIAGALFAILVAPAARAAPWTRDRVVLIVDDRSTNQAAAAEVSHIVLQLLTSKGYEVVPAAGAAPGSIEQLRQSLHAEAVVTITVSFLLEARPRPHGPRASPAFGLRARMLGAGERVVWRNALGWIADAAPQTVSLRKAPPRPAALACERLLWSLPRGRPDPDAPAAVAALEEVNVAKAPTSTRYNAPLARQRNFTGVAHFPLRIGR
jgi:hypothetical protein